MSESKPGATPPANAKPTLSWSTPSTTVASAKHISSIPPTPMQTNRPSRWWLALVSFILGALAMSLWQHLSSPKSSPTQTSSQSAASTTASTDASVDTDTAGNTTKAMMDVSTKPTVPPTGASAGYSNDSVSALSSQPAGSTVTLSNISVSAPTWAVVYDNKGGVPAGALGAGYFRPGETSGSIPLLRSTEAGKSYFVGLQTDDGDHSFELRGDPQVIDAQGRSVLSPFTVQ